VIGRNWGGNAVYQIRPSWIRSAESQLAGVVPGNDSEVKAKELFRCWRGDPARLSTSCPGRGRGNVMSGARMGTRYVAQTDEAARPRTRVRGEAEGLGLSRWRILRCTRLRTQCIGEMHSADQRPWRPHKFLARGKFLACNSQAVCGGAGNVLRAILRIGGLACFGRHGGAPLHGRASSVLAASARCGYAQYPAAGSLSCPARRMDRDLSSCRL